MTIKFRDFIKLANLFYKSVGLQPFEYLDDQPPVKLLPNNFIFYLVMTNMNMQLVAQVAFTVSALIKKNFVEGIMTMSYTGFLCVANYKMISVTFKKPVLTKFMLDLQELFPLTREQQNEYQLRRYAQKCVRISTSYSLLYMILIWTYNLFAIMQYLIYDHWLQLRPVGKALPYFMYVPWDWHDHWSYYMLYAVENAGGYASAACQVASDLLLTATATQIIMHFDYVARSIEAYTPGQNGRDSVFLQRIITYHERIFKLSDDMNNIFGVSILLNFITSALVICFVGFQMTIGVTTDTLLKLLLFLISSIAQVYLICDSAQELITASENVALAVYRQNWHPAEMWYQKMLVLIAARSQKAAVLQATSFLSISRSTMSGLLQISYKFFALIRTIYKT